MSSPAQPASGWRFLLRALGRRNYRLFFSGQSLSLIGTWMTRIATSWLVYRLTGSAWMLGLIAFLGQVPAFLLGPFAGVWVDRWNRHRTLVWTQNLSMLQSFALAVLAFSGRINVWQIALLSVAQGIINAFDTPARQAFLIEMVEDRAILPNAIALNSTMFNSARLIGPAVGGFIIAAFGEAWCFTIDGISYGAVILSLLLMHVAAAPPRRREEENLWRELAEGFHYVFGSVPIRSILAPARHRQPRRHALRFPAPHLCPPDLPRQRQHPWHAHGIHRSRRPHRRHSPWPPAAPSSAWDAASDSPPSSSASLSWSSESPAAFRSRSPCCSPPASP